MEPVSAAVVVGEIAPKRERRGMAEDVSPVVSL
jgi:hypothetical protein